MSKVVSSGEARRNFFRLLQGVRKGYSYVVTSHGKPVAKIAPAAKNDKMQAAARSALLARLRSQRVVDIRGRMRHELYDEAE